MRTTPALPSQTERGLPRGAKAAWAICVSLCLTTLAGSAIAQGVGAVPLSDPVYRIIDRLDAAGLLDTLIRGQRPYSLREVTHLLVSARRKAANADLRRDRYLRESLDSVEQRFLNGPASPIDWINANVTATNSTPRFVPADIGIGEVDAVIAPLAVRAQPGGRDALRGTTFAIETRHHLALGDHGAIDAQPRFRASTRPSFVGERAVSLQTLSLSGRLANVDATVGRDHLEWGQGRLGGLAFSVTAPPLDAIRVSTDRPWVLPGWLRVVGPSALSFMLADLGPTQYFPHTKLAAYKWSAKPIPHLEVGAGALDFVGGRGAPRANFGKQIANLFLFPILPTEGYEFSNTIAHLEARLTLARARGAQAYWEVALDDFDYRRFSSSVWTDDAAHLIGLMLPRLGYDGATSVTLEVHHTGSRFGRHLQFQSGAATKHFLLGDPLGPNAFAQYAFLDRTVGVESFVTLALANESYRADQHILVPQPFRIRVAERRPRETRQRALFTFRRAALVAGAGIVVDAGVERTAHFAFAPSDTRLAAIGSISVNYLFRR